MADIETTTIEADQFFTRTTTIVDGASTLVEVLVPPDQTRMVAATTYVEVLIGATFTATETFVEDVSVSLTTIQNTYVPTALGGQGSVDYCVKDQMGNGECIQELWNSGDPLTLTSTFSIFNAKPALSTFTVHVVSDATISSSKHRKIIGAAVGGVLGGLLCIAVACLILVRKNNIRKADERKRRNSVTMARLGVVPRHGEQVTTGPYAFSIPAGGYVDSKVDLPRTEAGYGADVKERVDV